MNNIHILDCTLRDGGYINDWKFGERTIKNIIKKLSQSNIDIIECGLLKEVHYDCNRSLFDHVSQIKKYIEPKGKDIQYVAMIDQPYISIDKISDYDGTSIDGIRVTFHEDESEISEALNLSKQLIEKGYKVFIQPVGTTSYTDEKLLQLIHEVNQLNPYAFYLVDTLGIMYKNNLLRLFHLLDHNLAPSICIGFHSHNNLQLSFSNAQELMSLRTKRKIIIDSSVFGMGRGAGNLCTELISQYINENIEQKYYAIPLLEIVDEYLSLFCEQPKWGYSVPYFLAATNNCHPNYAAYLINKQTITVKAINNLLKQLPEGKKDIYDKSFIEDMYLNQQKHYINDEESLEVLARLLTNKKILLLGPGKTLNEQKDKIENFILHHNPFIISVNFIHEAIPHHAAFISNQKRFNTLLETLDQSSLNVSMIVTSNIKQPEIGNALIVNYTDLLVDHSNIADDAGLMLLNLLNRLSITSVYLAGFDGFSAEKQENYYSNHLINSSDTQTLLDHSLAVRNQLRLLERRMDIHFVTDTSYENTFVTF
jgi:4-hydroxy 2-oxovalerate aldolase